MHPHGTNPAPHDFTRLSLWTAANLAGMVTAVLLLRGPFYRALAARAGRAPRHQPRKPSRRRSLSLLAGAVLGSDKSTIESVFGPPRSTAVPEIGAVIVHPQKLFWIADQWFYPLVRDGHTAMAITFEHDHATHVEFFTAPNSGQC
jgi:hypothetical protein